MRYNRTFESFSSNKDDYDWDYANLCGEQVLPEERVYHLSHPSNRASIERKGLELRAGAYYQELAGGEGRLRPAIFATNSDNENYWFETETDDDVWEIDTTKIPNVWYADAHYDNFDDFQHMVTFEVIPPEALSLYFKGSGKTRDEAWETGYGEQE